MDESHKLQDGAEFGTYTVVRQLGEGAFGAVYEALKRPLNKRVALKVLHPHMSMRGEALERFLQEARTSAGLRHPNIVDVTDLGVAEGRPFLAMEFLEGTTLAGLLEERGRLSLDETLTILLPVFSAVQAVHEQQVVHRDLKPENIFLARLRGGRVQPKLLDFGIAKVREASGARTRTGVAMGTPFYMSPEQVNESKDVDSRSDLWALTVILYECLCGKRIFERPTLLLTLRKIMEDEAPRLSALVAGCPPGLDSILLRGLERDRDRRYASVTEFGAALLPFAPTVLQTTFRSEFEPADDRPERRASTGARSSGTVSVEAEWSQGTAAQPHRAPRTLSLAARSVELGGAVRASRRQHLVGALVFVAVFGIVGWVALRNWGDGAPTSPRAVAPSAPPVSAETPVTAEPPPVARPLLPEGVPLVSPPPESPLDAGAAAEAHRSSRHHGRSHRSSHGHSAEMVSPSIPTVY